MLQPIPTLVQSESVKGLTGTATGTLPPSQATTMDYAPDPTLGPVTSPPTSTIQSTSTIPSTSTTQYTIDIPHFHI